MEETPLEAIPTFTPQRRQTNKRSAYLILAIVVLVVLFLGYKTLFSGSKTAQVTNSEQISITATPFPTSTPTAEESPSASPTLTPKPTSNPVDQETGLDRSKLSVTVENGSGEAGVAGKASDALKALGYDVVSSGNADNFDYTNVTIQVKSSKSDFLSLLKKDLGFDYTIGNATSDLPDSFSSDALVIIGK
jgi:hypothetical protein